MEKAEGIVRYVMEGIFGRRGVRRASAELSYQEPLRETPFCEDEPPPMGGSAYNPLPALAGAVSSPNSKAAEPKPAAEAAGWTNWEAVVREHEVRSASVREEGCEEEQEPCDGESSQGYDVEIAGCPDPDYD